MNMLLKTLVQFHYDEKAKELQTKYDKFLTLIEKSIPEIWLQETEESTTQPVRLSLCLIYSHPASISSIFSLEFYESLKPWSGSDNDLDIGSDCSFTKHSAFRYERHMVLRKGIKYIQTPLS